MRWPLKIALALVAALPSLAVRLAGIHPGAPASVLLFGAAIVAAAFLLAWAAEAAQGFPK